MAKAVLFKETFKPKERIEFERFRFVAPTKGFCVPKFKCCGGVHTGKDVVQPANDIDLRDCANEIQKIAVIPPQPRPADCTVIAAKPPAKRQSSNQIGGGGADQSFDLLGGGWNEYRLSREAQPPSAKRPSFGDDRPSTSHHDNYQSNDWNTSNHRESSNNWPQGTSQVNESQILQRPVIVEDQPMDDVVEESDHEEEFAFGNDPADFEVIDNHDHYQPEELDSFDADDDFLERNAAVDNEFEQAGTSFGFPPDPSNNVASNKTVDLDDSFDEDVELVPVSNFDPSKLPKPNKSGKRHDMHGQFRGFLKDDSEEFEDEETVLGKAQRDEMYRTLKDKFGFNSFRHRQKPAIVAILKGYDTFVLMPTGAGKSLCYQLPSVISAGVTVVVSPLKSLIEDQKYKMKELDISCGALTGELSMNETEAIYQKMMATPPKLKLVYVTPEKISASDRLCSVFATLHRNGTLARFVIDEAHCVSQWGHDFRPDYTKLSSLRRMYAGVPIVALTATATPKILADTRDHLSIKESKLFMSSFVRTNLTYEIRPRETRSLENAMKQMRELYPRKSGIIYCLSTKDCEATAKKLISWGFRAHAYHAKMADNPRKKAQMDWLANRVDIICATIAFGMGIDKPDVRFVIHFNLPKSLEGYYQETGRAGRDGLSSYCLLLYSYQDSIRLRKFIEDNDSTVAVRSMHTKNILQMIAYCENISTCRRKQLVEYFGEVYDAQACMNSSTPCDACTRTRKNPNAFKLFDFTEEAKLILTALPRLQRVTVIYLAELFRGALKGKSKQTATRCGHESLPFFGRGHALPEQDALRFMRKLIVEGYMLERIFQNSMNQGVCAYPELTEKGREVAQGRTLPKLFLHIATEQKRKSAANAITMLQMATVTEAQALKEKHVVKYREIFHRCLKALDEMAGELASQHFTTKAAIISREGMEQIAALLPRTNSDLLQVDTMTAAKIERYGATIMESLKPFWEEVDRKDSEEIKKDLEKLKDKDNIVLGGTPNMPTTQPTQPSAPIQSFFKATGFGTRAGARGGKSRFTPKFRKRAATGKGSQSSTQSGGSSGGTRAKRASFRPVAKGNRMIFPS